MKSRRFAAGGGTTVILKPGEKLSVGDKVTFHEVPDASSPYPAFDVVAGGESVMVVLSAVRPIDGPGNMTGVVHVEWNVTMAANWVS